jgi:hypothetical protein
MSIRAYLMGEKQRQPTREIEARAMELLCKLQAETSKSSPDDAVVSALLDDADVLVSDYRLELARQQVRA